MAVLLYNLATQAYFFTLRMAAVFNEKARKWTDGRVGVLAKVEQELAQHRKQGQPLLWMHCASLGEFEQGRPVLEAWKNERPDWFVLLTFFSPSGFELRKNYSHADAVFYLPNDSAKNAQRWLGILRPQAAVFVKYEFWYHYLQQLRQRKIPTFLISATFRKRQPFFRWYGGLHREMLRCFTKIMVQDKPSANLLTGIGIGGTLVGGDTRVDRVLTMAANQRDFPLVEKFCGNAPVLVCGSTWAADEKVVATLLQSPGFADWKLVVAPHEISPSRCSEVEAFFSKKLVFRYSAWENESLPDGCRVLLIDNIGMLAGLYRYGKVAYIGGGFGTGIHNLLEPMAFGLPVIFGPRFGKFVEAKQAIERGCGYTVGSGESFLGTMLALLEPEALRHSQQAANDLVQASAGATTLVLHELRKAL